MTGEERWRVIEGFDGYEVSDQGNIRSVRWRGRGNRQRQNQTPRVLRPWLDGDGYRRVTLRRDNRSVARDVAALVLEAFVGRRPERHDACHNNGRRDDDRLGNLRWDTRAANLADREQHGTMNRGQRNGAAKLTDEQARAVHERIARGDDPATVATAAGISRQHAVRIANGKRRNFAPC